MGLFNLIKAFNEQIEKNSMLALEKNKQPPKRKAPTKRKTPTRKPLSIEDISKQILAQRDSLRRNGFKKYTIIANSGCCEICAELNGKHFLLSQFKIGVNAPPMHEGCKCSIAAYEDEEEYQKWLNSF